MFSCAPPSPLPATGCHSQSPTGYHSECKMHFFNCSTGYHSESANYVLLPPQDIVLSTRCFLLPPQDVREYIFFGYRMSSKSPTCCHSESARCFFFFKLSHRISFRECKILFVAPTGHNSESARWFLLPPQDVRECNFFTHRMSFRECTISFCYPYRMSESARCFLLPP